CPARCRRQSVDLAGGSGWALPGIKAVGIVSAWWRLRPVTMAKISTTKSKESESGKLRIGDDWNAIRIIALSQSNPLKAIAEFVENSIDAHAKTIAITRGREHGEHYLTVRDDGHGAPRDPNELPHIKHVATHICDSVKRRLKADGAGLGLQGEFGIGLLSF